VLWTSYAKIVLRKYPKEQGTRMAVLQMMRFSYKLFLLFKFGSLSISETTTANQDIALEGLYFLRKK
jgi:hypothetical protein